MSTPPQRYLTILVGSWQVLGVHDSKEEAVEYARRVGRNGAALVGVYKEETMVLSSKNLLTNHGDA